MEMGWPSMAASASMPPTPQPRMPRPFSIVVWLSVPTQVSGYAWSPPRRRHHHARQVLDVHLVHDAGAGRDDAEAGEGVLAPAQELEALAVALELQLNVAGEGVRGAEEVGDHRVVDDQLGGDERVDLRRVAAERPHRLAHRGQVDDRGDAGQVLQDHPGRGELDLGVGLRLCGSQPARASMCSAVMLSAVLVAEQVLEQHLQAVREVLAAGDRVQAVDLVRAAARLKRRAAAEAVRSHRRLSLLAQSHALFVTIYWLMSYRPAWACAVPRSQAASAPVRSARSEGWRRFAGMYPTVSRYQGTSSVSRHQATSPGIAVLFWGPPQSHGLQARRNRRFRLGESARVAPGRTRLRTLRADPVRATLSGPSADDRRALHFVTERFFHALRSQDAARAPDLGRAARHLGRRRRGPAVRVDMELGPLLPAHRGSARPELRGLDDAVGHGRADLADQGRLPGHRHALPAPGGARQHGRHRGPHLRRPAASSGSARRGTRWSAPPTAYRCRR